MRISGGSAKGRKVGSRKAFVCRGDSDELRPTAAKVRQAIFNIIAGKVDGCRFLDLYAGTGAVGIEAISRGASHVAFVESNIARTKIIKQLLDKFGFTEKASVMHTDADSFLYKISHGAFDVIFIDPPYASSFLSGSLRIIDKSRILKEGGIVIAEHSSKTALPSFQNLVLQKKYRYGDTALTLYNYCLNDNILSRTEGKE
ncbi:MAG TPA: 16S rRNA (guanine(966)-N(2))-methyltransferase RsmD [Dissulfurispiraceae bacterium]|nr:16S rRNA (guanine(966)-N(2))-methyltransferase RsmD [Dissulfurispiraceae bacterium]